MQPEGKIFLRCQNIRRGDQNAILRHQYPNTAQEAAGMYRQAVTGLAKAALAQIMDCSAVL